MDRKYSPLPGEPLAPVFTIWTSSHKIVFSGHFSALNLLPSLTKLVEIPLLPTEMLSSIEGRLKSILSSSLFLTDKVCPICQGFCFTFL